MKSINKYSLETDRPLRTNKNKENTASNHLDKLKKRWEAINESNRAGLHTPDRAADDNE